MMSNLVLLFLFSTCILTVPTICEDGIEADKCTADVCKASEGCRCASSITPLDTVELTPQLVSLTFDEALTDNLVNLLQFLLFDRVNPDGCPIGATFFVPHEYTDYDRVNDLYNNGFEIGVNSITKSVLANYWPLASAELLVKEFGGQKKILNKFGNIPEKDIIGARAPQLQLSGNHSIIAYQAAGLTYDSSWPTLPDKPLYPYSLDYLTTQQCILRNICPNEGFKGFWILPIIDLRGEDNRECSTVPVCNVTDNADEIAEWLIGEIDQIRTTTRAPLTLRILSYWFEFYENSLEGFINFLDKLVNYDDVFLVTQKQVLDWMKNPVPLNEFKTDFPQRNATCTPYKCQLKKPDGDVRYLKSCIPCPAFYPWLDNPDGN